MTNFVDSSPQGGNRLSCPSVRHVSCWLSWGLRFAYPQENWECYVPRVWNIKLTRLLIAFSMKSVPSRPAASKEVSTLGTHGYIRVHSARNIEDFYRFTVRFLCGDSHHFSIRPVGVSTHCSLCLKSDILVLPLFLLRREVPCSDNMETKEIVTALIGALEWEELSSFAPFTRFPDSSLAL
jgi:hypothetical protein